MSSNPTNDTDPRVEAVLVAGYRAMSVSQKLARVTALTQAVQELALLDIRRRHPHADQRELALRLASRWLDPDVMKRAFGWDVHSAGFQMLSEPILVVARIVQALDVMGIPYVVGGSLASSIYGVPRATQDVDLVADLKVPDAEKLEQLLSGEFYVDADMIRDAILKRASFNVIHLATMFKADVFVMKRDAWSREEMSRARPERLEGPDGAVTIRFASPEDTLLHKLVWFRLGNEISDRQWSDILGVIKIQGQLLDGAYLDRWAPLLDVADLLARARAHQ